VTAFAARASAAAALALAAACAAPVAPAPPRAVAVARATPPPPIVRSNILRADYAGSQACASCHPDEFDKFMVAPMHNMTRLPASARIEAPFDGGVFRFKDDAVRFATRDGERFMTIESQRWGRREFKITKVIGGHYREDFAGVEVGNPDTKDERILPATYFLATKTWRYKGYSVLGPERPGLRPGGIWNKTCIFCHNTVPYFSDLLGAIADARVGPYQGEVVDPLLPAERRARYVVSDERAFIRAADDELRRLGARPTSATSASGAAGDLLRATRARFDASRLLEVGIGCESCHGGAAEHVKHNATRPSFEPHSDFLRVVAPAWPTPPAASSSSLAASPSSAAASTRAIAITRVCARCHQVLFTQYPWTWEGAPRAQEVPGGGNINSGEARDFLLGGCATRMTCSDCHDPHAHNKPHEGEIEARADGVCLRCHGELAGVEAQRAHTHHDPAGAGGRCLACHMPKKNLALDNGLSRYHRIASPTDRVKVEGDRPLECALCHGDKSVGALVTAMERWWGKSYDRARLAALYGGELEHADPLVETVARGKPHEQAVALALLGARGDRRAAPLVAAQLTHAVPIVRYYAVNALVTLLGGPAPLDVHARDEAIVAAAARWLAGAGMRPLAPATGATGAMGGAGDNEDQ
jgi:hypothetical protein